MVRGERRIAEWDFAVGGARYKVQVYMVSQEHNSYRQEEPNVPKDAKAFFRAEYRDAALRISDVNIDNLRKRTEEYLETWAAISWKLCIHIRTEVGHGQIEFSYKWVAIGERKDGKFVNVDVGSPSGCGPFCKDTTQGHVHDRGVDEETGRWSGAWEPPEKGYWSTQEGLPEVGKREGSYSGNARYALVDATPESYLACWTFEKALNSLGRQIQTRFMPKQVDATLADIAASLPRLPAPKEGS